MRRMRRRIRRRRRRSGRRRTRVSYFLPRLYSLIILAAQAVL